MFVASCSDEPGTNPVSCIDTLSCNTSDAGANIRRDANASRGDIGNSNIIDCGADNHCIPEFGYIDYLIHTNDSLNSMTVWDRNGENATVHNVRPIVLILKRRGVEIDQSGNNIYSVEFTANSGARTILRGQVYASDFDFFTNDRHPNNNPYCNCGTTSQCRLVCSTNSVITTSCLNSGTRLSDTNRCRIGRMFYSLNSSNSNNIFFRHTDGRYISLYFTPISGHSTTGI